MWRKRSIAKKIGAGLLALMMCSTVCEPLYAAESGGTLLTQESEETVQSGEESAGRTNLPIPGIRPKTARRHPGMYRRA